MAESLESIAKSQPEPLPGTVLRVLGLATAVLFAWLCIGEVDVIAQAPGRLVPATLLKSVQAAEPGEVRKVFVKEGDHVKKGQPLLELDTTQVAAELAALSSEAAALDLRVRRIRAELTSTALLLAPGDDPVLFASAQSLLQTRRLAHQGLLAQEHAGLAKLRADHSTSAAVLAKLDASLSTYEQASRVHKELAELQLQPQLSALEKEREYLDRIKDVEAQRFAVQAAKSAIAQQEQRIAQVTNDYLKELRQEEAEAVPKLNRLRQELIKQKRKATLMVLSAPADGVVKELSVRSPGAVVTAGSMLLTLVPDKEKLLAEVWVRNEDAGFVDLGQKVQVKVAAYPFQKYGLLHGKVTRVSPDSSETPVSSAVATPSVWSQPAQTAAQPPVFKALVELDSQALAVDNKRFDLRAGMQVVAEVNQGRRTVLEYLLSPVKKAVFEAARER